MSAFTIYNYQFEKTQRYMEASLFPNDAVLNPASEYFSHRQEIFGQLLMDDYNAMNEGKTEGIIQFVGKKDNCKIYRHKHLMKPTDDIIVMKVANRRVVIRETPDFTLEEDVDFPSLVVIIDNRPGIQRIAIEKKTKAFESVKTVENILSETFSQYLYRYNMRFVLYQMHEPCVFWKTVNDIKRFPLGFKKISFHLPYLNLERLTKVIDKYLTEVRRNYDCSLDWQLTASSGGRVRLDEHDPHQYAIIEGMTEHIGGKIITLYPVGTGMKPIYVGDNSYLIVNIDEALIKRLTEDMKHPNAFGCLALDKIKIVMKTKIDESK